MNNGLTKQQLEVHNLLQNNLPYFCKRVLKLKDKDGGLFPFVLNRAQLFVHKRLEQQKMQTGKVRAIIVKGRQVGASTYIGARFYHQATRNKGKNVFILAHETGSTIKLFDMVKRFHDYTPEALRPRLKNSNSRGLIFKDLDSQYFVGSAGNESVGRGGTLQMLHGCVAEDSLVDLSDGTRKYMCEMQAGDKIITSTGKIAFVKTVIKTGKKQLYKIEVDYADTFIEVSGDHKILTFEGYKRAEELTEHDYIQQPYIKRSLRKKSIHFSMKGLRSTIASKKHAKEVTIKFDKQAIYFFSAFIIAGVCAKQSRVNSFNEIRYGTIHITINNFSKDFTNNITDFVSRFSTKYKIRKGPKTTTLIVNSTILSEFCNKHFLSKDGEKVIPNWLLNLPALQRRCFFRNLSKYIPKETSSYLNLHYKKVKSVTKTTVKPTLDLEVDHKDHNFSTPIGIISNSEVAFWPNTTGIRTGLMQSVPKKPGTEIVLESTAFGIGNMFNTMATDALAGKNDYQVIFLPWYWMDDYEIPAEKDFKRTPEEQEIVENYLQEYSKEQQNDKLKWRRIVLSELGSLSKFRQEYPNNFVEAFQASGESLIKPADIIRARSCTKTDPEAPIVFGVDPARNLDRSCIAIRQGRHLIKYYVYEGMDSMSLSGIVANLMEKYNPLMVNIDIGIGYGVIDRLIERGYRNVNAIHFSSRANEPEIYRNIRAEMYVRLAEWFKADDINVPDDDTLHADLIAVPDYQPTSDGTIRLAPKADIIKAFGKSPDIADAVALTHALNYYGRKKRTLIKTTEDTWSKWD